MPCYYCIEFDRTTIIKKSIDGNYYLNSTKFEELVTKQIKDRALRLWRKKQSQLAFSILPPA
jgi:hypothetical protein